MTIATRVFLIPIDVGGLPVTRNSSELVEHALANPDQFAASVEGPDGTFKSVSVKELCGVEPRMVSIMRPPRTTPLTPKRKLVPHRTIRSGFGFKPVSRITPYQMSLGKLQYFLKGLLGAKFGGDLDLMAKGTGLSRIDLETYLDGGLPTLSDTLFAVSKRLGIDTAVLTTAWMIDAMAAIDYVHPIAPQSPSSTREFVKIVRLTTLCMGGLGAMARTLRSAGYDDLGFYTQWNDVFKASPSRAHSPHWSRFKENATELIAAAGTASRAEVIVLLEDIANERRRKIQNETEIPVGNRAGVIGRDKGSPLLLRNYAQDPFKAVFQAKLSRRTSSVIDRLSFRQRRALKMYFGIGIYHSHSFGEIAQELGCTRENVRLLVWGAIEALKWPARRMQLEPFAEYIAPPEEDE